MKKIWAAAALLALLSSCKDDDPIIIPDPASEGKQVQIDGNVGEQTGAAAGNSVFIDFSADQVTPLLRQSWDLGFYCDDAFRVIINNTTAAMAYVTAKTDINTVGPEDTAGVTMKLSLSELSPELFAFFDDVDGKLSGTVIPQVSATDDDNKVVVINRGTAGSVPARDFYKVRILRNGASGYTLQYARLDESSFRTLDIPKNADYHFQLISFDEGVTVAHPQKNDWDIQWSLSIYKTPFSATEYVPYAFSDMVAINYLNGTQAVEKEYETAEECNAAFESYSAADLSAETLLNDKWVVGSGWRRTAAPGATEPAGTIKTKFYVVKDHEGNAYKVKFLSFSSEDGGERGKPELKYVLLQ